MGVIQELLHKLERLVGTVAVHWPMHRALRALRERRWLEAHEGLAAARRVLERVEVPTDVRALLDEAWLTVALQLASEAPHVLESVCHELGVVPAAARAPALRDLAGLRALAVSLLDDGELDATAALARCLAWFVPATPSRDYLAARLLDAVAHALVQRTPLDGARVLQLRGEAEACYRSAEAACADAQRANLARVRRAGMLLRLGGLEDAVGLHEARAALGALNPFELRPHDQLVYAAAQLESPRRMRRVRALDLLEALGRGELAPQAARLLEHRLSSLGATRDMLELDRLEGAIATLLDEDAAAAARDHLEALERHGEADVSLETLTDPVQRRYQVTVLAVLRGEHDGLPVPSALATAYDAGRVALVQSRAPSPEGIARLHRFYRGVSRREDLVPLAALLPVCLERWEALELAHDELRELTSLYAQRAPTPRYGFMALAELALAADESLLAAHLGVRALRDAHDEALATWPAVVAASERSVQARIGEMVMLGVRALVEAQQPAAARGLLTELRDASA